MNVQEFAAATLDRHREEFSAAAWEMAHDAYAAGEYEVAAICAVEDAPNITAAEVDELARLSRCFDDKDAAIARRVIGVARRRFAA